MTITIAALGCSGSVAAHIIHGFLNLEEDVTIRILARNPSVVEQRYSQHKNVEVIQGSMSDPDSVARAVEKADAAFLITPMGMNNDPSSEIAIAEKNLQGAVRGNVRHLIYASVLRCDDGGAANATGVGILDAKVSIEEMIASSGLDYSILRCGSYMEDVFDPRLNMLKMGAFLFPIDRRQTFSYTAQSDISKFIAQELVSNGPLNGCIDFVEPGVYSIAQVEEALSSAAGFRIRTTPKMPIFYIFKALLPIFGWMQHRFSSVIPLMEYFDAFGYTGNSKSLSTKYPTFTMKSLDDHLKELFLTNNQVAKKQN